MLPIDFSALLASSIHDIKNSLVALRALLAQLEMSSPDPKPIELKHLNFEANRMNNNLMQLLILYKIDMSKFSPTIDEHRAVEILEDVAAQQSTIFPFGFVQLITQCDKELLCYCDSNLIGNALCTLVNNAQRYCLSKVLLSVIKEDNYVVFSIEDDGEGYPESLVSADYKHFPLTDLASGNTGLGLFFTDTIAKLHTQGEKHGFVITDNKSQFGGARFRLYLP
jgi:K+-sensing histidine kinase KdpD